jgi:hypothetical protein
VKDRNVPPLCSGNPFIICFGYTALLGYNYPKVSVCRQIRCYPIVDNDDLIGYSSIGDDGRNKKIRCKVVVKG